MWTITKRYDENLDIFISNDKKEYIKVAKKTNGTGTIFKDGEKVVEGTVNNYKTDGEIVLDVNFESAVTDDLGNIYCELTGEDTKVLYVQLRNENG